MPAPAHCPRLRRGSSPGRLALALAACAALTACSSFDGATQRIAGVVTPYRMAIVQGNFVSLEQVQALRAKVNIASARDAVQIFQILRTLQ